MKKIIVLLLTLIIMLAILTGFTFNHYNELLSTEDIYPGIYINNIDVGGLSKEEALEKVESNDKYQEEKFQVYYEDLSYSYSFEDLGYETNYEDLVDKAVSYGKDGNFFDKLETYLDLRVDSVHFFAENSFNQDSINRVVEEIGQNVYIPPQNAHYDYENGQAKIVEGVEGRSLNFDDARAKVSQAKPNQVIELSCFKVEPEVTSASLPKVEVGLIGSATTNYSSSIQNRKDNIKHAASFLDGLVILPGQQISFNQTVGPISTGNGYKSSTVIVQGEYETGTGGGVCQVSSTMYGALSKADLQIDERHSHSKPQYYVTKGQDAAVAEGSLDLKFTNNFQSPVYIKAYADNDNITIEVHGNIIEKDYDVELVSAGKDPYYTSYKVKTKNGEEISREKYHSSNYYNMFKESEKV